MDEPRDPRHRQLDARSLRGLAHPLRIGLLTALRNSGPATASQLAQKLGESSGATSYHLRQLATHGFVEDAPEKGKGRERWWRAVDQGLIFDETLLRDPDPEVRGAAAVFGYEVASIHAQELTTWLGNRHSYPEEWDSASDLSDFKGVLTPELARELIQKMHELINSYAGLPEDTPGAQRIRIHTHLFPNPPR